MRSPFKFAQHGESGMWVSDAMPHLAGQVDDLALIRSMYTTNLTHEPALYLIQSGKMAPGRPSLGSWVVYGLGTENQNLPAYVVLDDPLGLPVNGRRELAGGLPAADLPGDAVPLDRLAGPQPAPRRRAALPRSSSSNATC